MEDPVLWTTVAVVGASTIALVLYQQCHSRRRASTSKIAKELQGLHHGDVLFAVEGDGGEGKMLRERAAAGDSTALLALGMDAYRGGPGRDPDFEKARSFFVRAAKEGEQEASFLLGVCELRGLGGKRDRKGGLERIEAAHSAGLLRATLFLGLAKRDGDLVRRDLDGGRQLLVQAAEKGCVPAYRAAGRALLEDGVDMARAVQFLQQGADAGDAIASDVLGVALFRGLGVAADAKKAEQCFLRAAAQDVVAAHYHLAILKDAEYEATQRVEALRTAFEHYAIAAEKGHPDAQINYALALIDGAPSAGVAADAKRAIELLEEASANGSSSASRALGQILLNGHPSIPSDPPQALRHFLKAANDGDAIAAEYAGKLLVRGERGIERNVAQARSLFERSISIEPRPDVYLALGILNERGMERKADVDAAAKMYEKAALLGQHQAPFRLGILLGAKGEEFHRASCGWLRIALDYASAEEKGVALRILQASALTEDELKAEETRLRGEIKSHIARARAKGVDLSP